MFVFENVCHSNYNVELLAKVIC